ncbi:MAG: HAD-IIIA family hydrolase [Lachnospiraceae bacterium]|nr:HAD-IIIA family hydrolase [Lachnospiraceae bacterium]
MKNIKQAVILAGGRGERLKPFTDNAPKPMYPVGGTPFLYRLIEQVKGFGINKILLLLGYKAEVITDALGDGKDFGIEVDYDITPPEFDTAQRLLTAADKIDDDFLLMYCDNYCPIDYERLVREYTENDALIQFSVYANKDGYTKNNLIVEDGKVTVYDKTRKTEGLAGVDIGYALINKKTFDLVGDRISFAAIYPEVVSMGRLYATVTEHRYYSIGSFERMKLTEEFFKPKKVVFLDRDGTLNVRPPKACYIERPEDFVWLPGAIEAVRLLKENGVITILISNQPGIARGNLTEETLQAIHDKMQAELRENGCEIDKIYYCPHNWDDGCDCRKPKPGMFYQAQKELSLNLRECFMFGDDERDIEAGEAAGCKSVLITEEYPLLKAVKDYLKGIK